MDAESFKRVETHKEAQFRLATTLGFMFREGLTDSALATFISEIDLECTRLARLTDGDQARRRQLQTIAKLLRAVLYT